MRVSVIIPAYRSAATIAEALDSVIRQKITDLEIIVVDDCSPDDIQAAVDAWQQALAGSGPPLSLLKTARNGGPAAARNLGLAQARGEWIAFLDADDAWMPDKLERQFAAIDDWKRNHPDNEPMFICGRALGWSDTFLPVNRKSEIINLKLTDFAVSNPVATSTVLARRDELLAAGGFDESFRGPEDYDLWIRLADGQRSPEKALLYLDIPLARYRTVEDSLSLDEARFLPQVLGVIEKAYGPGGVFEGRRAGRRKARAHQFLAAAWSAADRGRRGRAIGLFFSSLAAWPFSFRPEKRMPWARLKVGAYILRRWMRTA